MALKKRLMIAGIVCSLTTSQVVLSDGVNPPKTQKTTKSATQPPPLLAPPSSAKPLQIEEDDAKQTAKPKTKVSSEQKATSQNSVLKTAKLSPNEPKRINSSSPIAIENRTPGAVGERVRPKFVSLLPGSALEGWIVHEGRDGAWLREGEMISCRGAGGGWLRTEKEYSDFHLKLEYRYQSGCNTGLGIRCPSEGNPTFTGIEIQLLDDSAEKYRNLRAEQYTGSLYYQVAPTQKPELKPAGEWNQCEVICIGDQVTIKINGQIINEVDLAKPDGKNKLNTSKPWKLAERPPIGHIALQSHPSQVDFRNLTVKDLAIEAAAGVQFVDIADGEGEPVLEATTISIHYLGQLRDGTRFGDTRDFGEPVTVHLDEVIEGWKHGIIGMKVGGRRRLIVPPAMAYGSEGVENLIPPDATLVFEVELRGFER